MTTPICRTHEGNPLGMLLLDLLRKCEIGDAEAVSELVRRFRQWAMSFACAITDDQDLAEDAVQEAFVTALQHLADLREPDAFPGWFRQIIRTQAGRIVRKRRELPVPQDCMPDADVCSTEEYLRAQELRAVLHDALQSLPDTGRNTAELFYFEDMSCADISIILGVPEGTVKRRLYDARARLREMLLGYIRDEEPEQKQPEDPGFPL